MSVASSPRGGVPVGRLLRPQSIAIVGVSEDQGTIGARALGALERFGYGGRIHLVNPKRSEINGRPCVRSVDDLPPGVDVVMLAIPQVATVEAVQACARRGVGAAVVFTSGFSETGEEGIRQQQVMTEVARDAGLALLGPNCYGLVNFVDDIPLTSGPVRPNPANHRPGLAVLSQSGGMMGCLMEAAEARGIPLSYAVSTGNEAVVQIEDFLEEMVDDPHIRTIAMFAEQLRQPRRFLELAGRARALGKPIILLHSGRSERSREAARSHTGAMASDFTTMRTLVTGEAVLVVDDIEQVIDTAELLTAYSQRPTKGLAIITDSGAFKGLSLDFCETAGVDIPNLSKATVDALAEVMPEFADLSNPLDLTAQVMRDMSGMYGGSIRAMSADSGVGSILVCLLMGAPHVVKAKLTAVCTAVRSVDTPVVVLMLGGDSPLPEDAYDITREAGVPFFRSAGRALAAIGQMTRYGNLLKYADRAMTVALRAIRPLPRPGLLPEYLGKSWLAQTGVPIPAGALAKNIDNALAVACGIGYPVVLKAQSADLPHKSDAGGVIIGIHDPAALRAAWDKMTADLARACPGLVLDGILVEKMGERGLELVVGARRDEQWGPVLMIGLGGIWIEVLKDVVFLPADCDEAGVLSALRTLKGAAMLDGVRGAPAVDVEAVARTVVRLGQLILAAPEVRELDINPLVAYPAGQGVQALDVLIVSQSEIH